MTGSNRYPGEFGKALDGPCTGSVTVTKSDTVNLDYVGRWIRFDAAGTVKILLADGTSTMEATVAAGEQWPVQVLRVYDTGTSLTNAQIIIGR